MKNLLITTVFINLLAVCAFAQTTAFSHQGKLNVSGAPANGNYDFEFKLFDAASGGAQQGATVQRLNVAVANGIYALSLDFGAGTLTGADRYLDIAVRTAGGGSFTPLTPRQQLTSAPYAVKSLNAEQLGGVAANQYVTTTTGGSNFIQNTTTQQPSSNFNVSGTGTANIFSAATQFNIGTNRILHTAGTESVSVGNGAGAISSGAANTFIGKSAGQSNTTGDGNSFIGWFAGQANTGAVFNSFLGARAGFFNATGNFNSFVGYRTGENNNGNVNSFFGTGAGLGNTTGNSNTFAGHDSGSLNVSGSFNTTIGAGSTVGFSNLTNATAIGSKAFVIASNSLVLGSINGVNGATADTNVGIGTTWPFFKLQVVDSSNTGLRVQTSLAGGTVASFGGNGAFQIDSLGVAGGRFSVLENGNIGVGTTSPQYRLHVVGGNVRLEGNSASVFPRFSLNMTGGGPDAKKWQNYATANGLQFGTLNDAETSEALWLSVTRSGGNVSEVKFPSGDVVVFNKLLVGVSSSPDKLAVAGTVSLLLAGGGATQVCQNSTNQLSTCSSSLRYKTNIGRFGLGLSLVNQLKPITFEWKDGGMRDVGFGAEDVAAIEPLLVTYNKAGEVEGVKYDRLSVAFVNAFKEQQAEISELRASSSEQAKKIEDQNSKIEDQKAQIERQQRQLDALQKLVCAQNPTADVCKEEK